MKKQRIEFTFRQYYGIRRAIGLKRVPPLRTLVRQGKAKHVGHSCYVVEWDDEERR
jgi:hypothetical protein